MRRPVILVGVLFLVVGVAVPGVAAPPKDPPGAVVSIDAPFGLWFEDPAAGLVALGGPPPELWCAEEGFEDVPHHVVLTPAGAVKVLFNGDAPYGIYAASSVDEICESVAVGVVPQPIAAGTLSVVWTNSDVFLSGNGAGSFGGSATGTVFAADGQAWRVNASSRFLFSPKGGFKVLHEDVTMVEV